MTANTQAAPKGRRSGGFTLQGATPPITFRDRDRRTGRFLIKEIAGHCWDGKRDMLARVYRAVVRHNPATEITPRRIRGIWHREVGRISFSEMIELAEVAGIEAAARQGQ